MTTSDSYQKLPGFSQLFNDFNAKLPFFKERFRMNQQLFTSSEILCDRANDFNQRDILLDVIRSTMNSVELTSSQKKNLELLANRNSLVAITGQQVGFLGGPLYSTYKAISAIRMAESLESEYASANTSLCFVPVFWIEDNDHDSLEASKISLASKDMELHDFHANEKQQSNNRKSVSNLMFDEDIGEEIEKVESILLDTPFKAEMMDKIKEIYTPGKSWPDAFVQLMQYLLGDKGILFLSAAELRKSGVWKELVVKELDSIGTSQSQVRLANTILDINGYHIQATTSEINLFFHEDGKRFKIDEIEGKHQYYRINDKEYHYSDLQYLAHSKADSFSPNVLLRPVFQDYSIPTIAYVSGPSEIGYASQIRELYKFFNVFMPAFIPRHSATIVTPHTQRLLKNKKIDAKFFFRPWMEIEQELTKGLVDTEIDKSFAKIEEQVKTEMQLIEDRIGKIDKSFESSVRATQAKAQKLIDTLQKKLTSVQKKQNSEEFKKFKEASTLLYPKGTLQERYFSPLHFVNLMGRDEFIEKLTELCYQPNNVHWYL
jgi:bacillithiol synthase